MNDLQKRRLILMLAAGLLLVGGGCLTFTMKREGGEFIVSEDILRNLPLLSKPRGGQANAPAPGATKGLAVDPTKVQNPPVIAGQPGAPIAGSAVPGTTPGGTAPGATDKGTPVLPAAVTGDPTKQQVVGQEPVKAVGMPLASPVSKVSVVAPGIIGGGKVAKVLGGNQADAALKGKPDGAWVSSLQAPPNSTPLSLDPKAPQVDKLTKLDKLKDKLKEVDPDMDAIEPTATQTLSKKKIASIVRYTAQSEAKVAVGRTDPFMPPVESYKSFPSEHKLVHVTPPPGENRDQSLDDLLGGSSKKKSDKSKTKVASKKGKKNLLDGISSSGLVPPPPPLDAPQSLPGSADAGSVDLAELPPPPSRPAISGKLKLISIIGDKAVLAFTDSRSVHDNKWPKTITLGPGEQFESLSVADVNSDSVTIEEDGERTVKSLESIR